MRLLHIMLRVADLKRSIKFYTETLGMHLIKKSENIQHKYSLAFVGYDAHKETILELTYNWGIKNYDKGTAFGHIGLGVDNVLKTCNKIRQSGGNIIRDVGPVKGGKTIIAFIEDPDGYKIELVEKN